MKAVLLCLLIFIDKEYSCSFLLSFQCAHHKIHGMNLMALQVLYFYSQMQERLEKSQEELIEMQV